MSTIAILAIVVLVMWCGGVTRRLREMGASHYDMGSPSDWSVDALDDRFDALSEAHRLVEGELEERVLELEERLDFAERMLANGSARAVL
jgi:hypothetical protein